MRKRVVVKRVLEGRYAPGARPLSWDKRVVGNDLIETVAGETVLLASNGGQSTPDAGWELLLSDANTEDGGVEWTLYGIAKA